MLVFRIIRYHSDRDRGNALVGALRRGKTKGGAMHTTVVDRVPHPDFDEETLENDVMVVKLGGWVSPDVSARRSR